MEDLIWAAPACQMGYHFQGVAHSAFICPSSFKSLGANTLCGHVPNKSFYHSSRSFRDLEKDTTVWKLSLSQAIASCMSSK